ncbi:hypothetical protein V5O48_007459 [Marasmius crinis-equi]|uniref:Tryptophan synthase beta chain-like PALP domain-containing protein n=1 Tax=Marasmius crinis-equi TaxID=585013 RepID=A0ABR3FGP0_9AGAR
MTPKLYRNPRAQTHTLRTSQNPARDFHRKLFSSHSPTPLTSLPSIAKEIGVAHVFVKDESLRFGLPAFKILGASWATFCVLAQRLEIKIEDIDLDAFKEQLRCRGEGLTLYTATDGNHGRAVARVAALLDLKSKIFVPAAVSELSRDRIRSEGAEVVVVQADYDEAVKMAAVEAGDHGILIQDTAWPGYEEIPRLIVQGYTTLFSEVDERLVEEDLQPSLVVVPVGVGSLAHSAVQFYRSESYPPLQGPPPSILTVEPDTAACLNTSLHAGQSTPIETGYTIMPGLNCGTVSSTAWPDLHAGVDLSVVASDTEALKAMEDLNDLGIQAGPCGAAPLAALRALPSDVLDGSMVVVLICTEGQM